MSDKYPDNTEQELSQGGLSRRSFFKGASALTGACLLIRS
ncbi:twin-arginine translocation signal domain-containing protein [Aeromonas caviae]|nr:twin-arginine translocation signal domain-containing protein [Aeromonas caviae]